MKCCWAISALCISLPLFSNNSIQTLLLKLRTFITNLQYLFSVFFFFFLAGKADWCFTQHEGLRQETRKKKRNLFFNTFRPIKRLKFSFPIFTNQNCKHSQYANPIGYNSIFSHLSMAEPKTGPRAKLAGPYLSSQTYDCPETLTPPRRGHGEGFLSSRRKVYWSFLSGGMNKMAAQMTIL